MDLQEDAELGGGVQVQQQRQQDQHHHHLPYVVAGNGRADDFNALLCSKVAARQDEDIVQCLQTARPETIDTITPGTERNVCVCSCVA